MGLISKFFKNTDNEDIQVFQSSLTAQQREDAIYKAHSIGRSASEIDGIVAELDKKVISYNLINFDDFIIGENISSSGNIQTDISYKRSDFIPILPNTSYYLLGVTTAALYSSSKVFRTRFYTNDGDGILKITSATDAFLIVSRVNGEAILPMVAKSITALPYMAHGNFYTNESAIGYAHNTQEYSKNPILNNVPTGIFRTNIAIADHTGSNIDTYPVIYTLYDSLVATYPTWVTKHTMLPDKDGNPIYRYEFKAQRPSTDNNVKVPKIFMCTNTHGAEKAGTLAFYYLMKNLGVNALADTFLEYLRYEVDWIVIPVVNPSGFNLYTRGNSNGVDLNRNYDTDTWETFASNVGDATYKGVSPFSEPDTQNIKQVFDDNIDIDIAIDFHNFFETSNGNYFTYIETASDPIIENLASSFLGKQTRSYKKDTTNFPFLSSYNDYIGFTDYATIPNFARYAAVTKGIKYSGTYEICNRIVLRGDTTTHNELTIRWGSELITNWILSLLRQLSSENV